MSPSFPDLPEIETPRLLLRKLSVADANDLLGYAADPQVSRFTSWDQYASIADAHRFIHWAMDRYQRKLEAPWGIELKSEEKLIGTLGFSDFVAQNERAEVNYAISAKYWGQGLTPEALEHAIAFGFTTLQLHRIEARCMPENVASARVMEKVGMKYEGTMRHALRAKNAWHDLLLYAILRNEWPLPSQAAET